MEPPKWHYYSTVCRGTANRPRPKILERWVLDHLNNHPLFWGNLPEDWGRFLIHFWFLPWPWPAPSPWRPEVRNVWNFQTNSSLDQLNRLYSLFFFFVSAIWFECFDIPHAPPHPLHLHLAMSNSAVVHVGTPSPEFQGWATAKVCYDKFSDLSTDKDSGVKPPAFSCLGHK